MNVFKEKIWRTRWLILDESCGETMHNATTNREWLECEKQWCLDNGVIAEIEINEKGEGAIYTFM